MNQGKTEFGILAKENVSVQIGTDEVAFHHALETDWGGGAAILFSTDPTAANLFSRSRGSLFWIHQTLTENLCFLPIKLLSLPRSFNVGICLVRNGFKRLLALPLWLTK